MTTKQNARTQKKEGENASSTETGQNCIYSPHALSYSECNV